MWSENGKKDIRTPLMWLALAVLAAGMAPVFYLAGTDRASADDWSYGLLTHLAWADTHSLLKVLQAALQSVRKYYHSWQGTWFSVFLFTLQPEVFSYKAYWLVPYLMSALLIGGVSCFFYCLLVRLLHVSRRDFILLTSILLLVLIQFVPHQTSAFFWYNGAAHYTVPLALVMVAGACFLRFVETNRVREVVFAAVWMTLLGGTNYLAAILGLLLFFLLICLFFHRERRVLLMLIPVGLETVGLLVSALAPGNAVRGGNKYDISFAKVLFAVWEALRLGFMGIWRFFREYPIATAAMIVLAVLLWDILRETVPRENLHFPCPVFVIFYLTGTCFAMYWPGAFAGVSLSEGVPNMIYWTFILTLFGSLLYGLGWLSEHCGYGEAGQLHPIWYLGGFALAFGIFLGNYRDLKNSTAYVCWDYIRSGRAEEYRAQMDEFMELVTQEGVEDVVVPFIVGEQEPLVHLPVTTNPEEWSNQKMALFFRKRSLVAIPRDEWEKQGESR